MTKLYRVKLSEQHEAQFRQVHEGYLAQEGKILEYTRGHAIKKAKAFRGKIEFSREITGEQENLREQNAELLEALKSLLDGIENPDNWDDSLLVGARAAIAKAEAK